MKPIPKQAKKICKNRGASRPPLYISLKRRKTLGKSGVSSPGKWEVCVLYGGEIFRLYYLVSDI